jgi:eukaryotic-like serine/threonine-protein kinase
MAEPVSTSALPRTIGRHTVLGLLATGGMAEIFLGKEPGGRPVVIKRVLPHLARQPAFVSMFVDEARLSSLLRNPNIVEVHELGQVGFDLFMVMEYLEGESVHGLIRRSLLRHQEQPYALAAHVIADACAGLHAAHTLCDERGKPYGIVHRDISPSNIMVTYAGEVKVLDFGIATAAHRLTRTATGQVKGKFAYMSPEQCRGEPLDVRSDIFSLGVVLYELTVRRRLFKRANELMVLKAVTSDPIPSPRARALDYPRALEKTVMRALSRNPRDRHGSAQELRDELLEVIAQLGGIAEPGAMLSTQMTSLFPDRISVKQDMLRAARSGHELHAMPSAEVDEDLDESAEAPPTPAPQRRRRALWLVPLIAVCAAGVAIAWKLATSGPDIASPEPTHVHQMTALPARTPTVSPPTAPAPGFDVVFDSDPPGATLSIDDAVLGPTPYTLHLVDQRIVDAKLELAGFVTIARKLSLEHEQRVLVPLAPVANPAAASSPATAPAASDGSGASSRGKHPRTKPSDPFQRFD